MTARQTATAAGCDLKWLTNSAALLRRRLRHNAPEARWWGLVRLLVDEIGLSLKAAATAATTVLADGRRGRTLAPGSDPSGAAALVVDLPRYESIFLANLSRALVQETPRRRGRIKAAAGRRAITAAREYGIDVGLLQSALARSPAERLRLLDANVEFVKAARGVR
ncbi:MAG TPA: hypothetical protein VGN73_06795 [Gemmatimonadaceae bacterium]|nr:hypothetical protein [Gemmatimonadaceae bacterium]